MSFHTDKVWGNDRARLCENFCDGFTDQQLWRLLQLGGLRAMVSTLDKIKGEIVLVRFQVDKVLEDYDRRMQPELYQVQAESQRPVKSGRKKGQGKRK
jgi:hypothetical protein